MALEIATDPDVHFLFDLLAWCAAGILARFVFAWRLKQTAARSVSGIGVGYALALAVGVVAGAWGFGTLGSDLTKPSHSLAGGLAGGIIGVELYKAARGITGSTGLVWVAPLALGIAVGRLGCLFAGLPDDTYGTPTSMPWAVDLGDGIGRHPVQIYESVAMLAFLAVYLAALARRAAWTLSRAFYLFVIWYALQRFVWEFFKPYPDFVAGLNLFQLLALAMILYALIFDARARRSL
jgi:hypothetical protein